MVSAIKKIDTEVPTWDSNEGMSAQIKRMEHIMAVAATHKKFIQVIADALPYFGQLISSTKKCLLDASTIELIFLRAASNFDAENGVRSINGVHYRNICLFGVSTISVH